MSLLSLDATGNPARDTEVRFGKCRNGFRFIEAMTAVARGLWPKKTAVNLSSRADVSPRMAEYWLACKHEMSLESVQNLIQSDEGYEFLVAFMGDSKAQWWSDVQCVKKRIDIRRKMDEVQQEMRALNDE